jgi:hypothetical protein
LDTSYLEKNKAELERLRELVGRLTEDDLLTQLPEGWTIAATLAHCAFWDRFALQRWQKWERDGIKLVPLEIDFLNEANKPEWLVVPPLVAARHALEAAEAIDARITTLPRELLQSYVSAGSNSWMYESWQHRKEHLDEIESGLRISKTPGNNGS